MPRKRNNGLSEEKRNIIGQLVEMYEIKTAADMQEALKDLLGGTIQSMLETELSTQMREQEEADPEYRDSRNGYKPKSLKSSMGEIPISVPQDRNSDFEPQIVPKYKRDISEIEGKVISMYARGMSVRQISDQVRDIYGFDVSEGMVTAITNKLLPDFLGIGNRLKYLPGELSGGQRRRAAIARALINDPVILLADEPTGNLDKKAADEIMQLLLALNRRGNTVLLVTHGQRYADLCRRRIEISDGKILV